MHALNWGGLRNTIMDRKLPTFLALETVGKAYVLQQRPCKQILHSTPPVAWIIETPNTTTHRKKCTNVRFHDAKPPEEQKTRAFAVVKAAAGQNDTKTHLKCGHFATSNTPILELGYIHRKYLTQVGLLTFSVS